MGGGRWWVPPPASLLSLPPVLAVLGAGTVRRSLFKIKTRRRCEAPPGHWPPRPHRRARPGAGRLGCWPRGPRPGGGGEARAAARAETPVNFPGEARGTPACSGASLSSWAPRLRGVAGWAHHAVGMCRGARRRHHMDICL